MKTIYLGADHAGYALKEKVKQWLQKKRIPVEDCGNFHYNPDDDYPDFARKVAKKVVPRRSFGILFCGSAEGMCMAANKVRGVRAVNPHGLQQTVFARKHENANILCLAGGGSRQRQAAISFSKATRMITLFLSTPFSREERHLRRLNKIRKMEKS